MHFKTMSVVLTSLGVVAACSSSGDDGANLGKVESETGGTTHSSGGARSSGGSTVASGGTGGTTTKPPIPDVDASDTGTPSPKDGGGGWPAPDASRGTFVDAGGDAVAPVPEEAGPSTPPPTWHDLTPLPLPAAWPPARTAYAMAFDPIIGKIVLFGGDDDAGRRRDTWEWDSPTATWANRTPSTLPPSWPLARDFHGMTFDPAAGRVVMFGGGGNDGLLGEVYEWDSGGGQWVLRQASQTGMLPRNQIAIANAGDGHLLTFTGNHAEGSVQSPPDTWQWSSTGGSWTDVSPTVQPPYGGSYSLVYDTLRKRTVLEILGSQGPEVWDWRDATKEWTNRTPSPRPSTWVSYRADRAFAYHATRHTLMVYGGYDGRGPIGTLAKIGDDLWEWEGTTGTWTDLTPAVRPPGWPSTEVGGREMVFDSWRQSLILFGGMKSNGQIVADMYEWK